MKKIKTAILFDMDGVTIDTEPLYTKAEIKLFTEYGIEIPQEDWSLFRGSSESDFYKLSMARYNIKEDKDVFIKKGRQYVAKEFNGRIPFVPGFKSLHQRINKDYLMGLVTAAPKHMLNKINKLIHLDSYFKHMISGEEAIRNKPFPDPYIKMMNYFNVAPNNTIIIEDSVKGIRAALSAGAHVIARRGSVPDSKLQIAHRVISHLDEITTDYISELLQS
tara:strand:- start:562 stop:1221 length:660 start_codon:yes stop_codon:yes gene_type:complete